MEYYYHLETPIGYLKLTTDNHYLISVEFVTKQERNSNQPPDILQNSIQQLIEYFKGTRKNFNLELNPNGTEFQLKTWEMVQKVPFGKTASYLEIARQTGSDKNTRAVGAANGKNPIPIIIPCHRIVGVNGKLTGYAGGIERKRWLLLHEYKHSDHTEKLF